MGTKTNARLLARPRTNDKNPALSRAFRDGASGTRTRDLLIANQALSQLSYSPGRGEFTAPLRVLAIRTSPLLKPSRVAIGELMDSARGPLLGLVEPAELERLDLARGHPGEGVESLGDPVDVGDQGAPLPGAVMAEPERDPVFVSANSAPGSNFSNPGPIT